MNTLTLEEVIEAFNAEVVAEVSQPSETLRAEVEFAKQWNRSLPPDTSSPKKASGREEQFARRATA